MELVITVPFTNVTEFSLFLVEWPSWSVGGRLLILHTFKQQEIFWPYFEDYVTTLLVSYPIEGQSLRLFVFEGQRLSLCEDIVTAFVW